MFIIKCWGKTCQPVYYTTKKEKKRKIHVYQIDNENKADRLYWESCIPQEKGGNKFKTPTDLRQMPSCGQKFFELKAQKNDDEVLKNTKNK